MDTNTTGSTAGMSGANTTTSGQTGGVKQELASDAKTLGDAARGKVEARAGAAKDQATEAARSTSGALNKAVDALRDDSDTPQWLTKALETGARELDKLAGSFEGKDTRAIMNDVTDFGRRNPAAFLAAAAGVGFIAARFLRAGSDYDAHQNTGSGSSGSGAGSYGSTGSSYGSGSTGSMGASGTSSSYTGTTGTDRSSFAFDDDDTGSNAASSFEGSSR